MKTAKLPSKSGMKKGNSIHLIKPYQFDGVWVFDDDRFGLSREPFVMNADKVVNGLGYMCSLKPEGGFNMFFSKNKLPEAHAVWKRTGRAPENKDEGVVYYTQGWGHFWLCPALYHYFPDKAPATIYVRAESFEQQQSHSTNS